MSASSDRRRSAGADSCRRKANGAASVPAGTGRKREDVVDLKIVEGA